MFSPWHELKQAELSALDSRATGSLCADSIALLQKLFEQCNRDEEAAEGICYHGAVALIAEFEGDIETAIKHREIEITKIGRLHELARVNPGDRAALVNYTEVDLQLRIQILEELKDHTCS